MSAARTSAILVRLYPLQWRDRYGDELARLIVETSGDKVPWRVRLDVVVAASRERGRSLLGWSDQSPRETISSALSSVLWGWMLVVAGGCAVAKTAEHWQAATPIGSRTLPAHAFEILVGAAIVGSLVVVAGAALALPAVVRRLRGGQSGQVRSAFVVAVGSTGIVISATIGLAAWAHGLTTAQRNGHDAIYSGAFVGWVALSIVCLAAWTRLGARLCRRADIRSSLLQVEAWLAAAAATLMGAVTVCAVVWWAAVADSAPWYFTGGARGSAGAAVTWPLVLAGLLMVAGTCLAASSAVRALRAVPALRPLGRR